MLNLSFQQLFAVSFQLHKRLSDSSIAVCDYELPYYTSKKNPSFAKVYGAWSLEGLYFVFDWDVPFSYMDYPDYEEGDFIEIFINTRNVRQTRNLSKFCHHFYCLPSQPEGGSQWGEVTKFRLDDENRPLCSPKCLEVDISALKQGHRIEIKIAAEGLYGFNPLELSEIGFSYVIHSFKKKQTQFFFSDPKDFPVGSVPLLWSTALLLSDRHDTT